MSVARTISDILRLTLNSCQDALARKSGQMATKSQHSRIYRPLPEFLRRLREEAALTQRDLGRRMKKPQSWIYNCESANRRVDVTEFIEWATACGIDPGKAFSRFVESAATRKPRGR
jgi:ribosome-binding protein aMBF1 (putative translation factor)